MSAQNLSPDRMLSELQVSEEFLARYEKPGPRYTSYPTAPVWDESYGLADLELAQAEADRVGTPVSLYMHIPFCESLCLFCACNVVIQKDKTVAVTYLDVLKREIDRVSRNVSRARPIVQFHWGGGTPTYLTPPQMEDLFGFTAEKFSFAPDAEIGIEVDPRVTSTQHLETLSVTNVAVCSSGDYERISASPAAGHHIVDPRTGESPPAIASVTVVAPSATVIVAPAATTIGPYEYDLTAGPRGDINDALTQGPSTLSKTFASPATGSKIVDVKATGVEKFTNLTTNDIRIAKGTVVSTPDGIRFQTTEDNVLGKSLLRPIFFTSITINIVALEAGTKANVTQDRVTAGSSSEYSVTNPVATAGGDSKTVAVVMQGDYDKAVGAADDALRTEANATLLKRWQQDAPNSRRRYTGNARLKRSKAALSSSLVCGSNALAGLRAGRE